MSGGDDVRDGGEVDGELGSTAYDDGGDFVVEELAALDGHGAGTACGTLFGVGGAVEAVDELPCAGGGASESREDEGDERAALVEATCAVVAVFPFLPFEKHVTVVKGSKLAVGGEEWMRDGDVDGDG